MPVDELVCMAANGVRDAAGKYYLDPHERESVTEGGGESDDGDGESDDDESESESGGVSVVVPAPPPPPPTTTTMKETV